MTIYIDRHAEILKARSGEPWRPSNGTEGDIFMAQWCERCALADYDGDGCMIQLRALAHSIGDPEYPPEWQIGPDGQPCCTAFDEADQLPGVAG